MVEYFKSLLDFYSNNIFNSTNLVWNIILIVVVLLSSMIIATFTPKNMSATNYYSYIDVSMLFISIISQCHILENILLFIRYMELKYMIISFMFVIMCLIFEYNFIEYEKNDEGKYVIVVESKGIRKALLNFLSPHFIVEIAILLVTNIFFHYDTNVTAFTIVYYIIYIALIVFITFLISFVVQAFRNKKLCKFRSFQHRLANILTFLVILFVIINPSNINFVNNSPISYGTIPQWLNSKISSKWEISNDSTPTSTTDTSNYEIQNITIDQTSIEYAKSYLFDLELLNNLTDSQLNCHEYVTSYLNEYESSYDNQIMDSIIYLTKNYRVNPSYLVTKILGYDKSSATSYSVISPTDKLFNISLSIDDKASMSSEDYAKFVFKTLEDNFSPTANNSTDIQVSFDTDVWYTYFAFYTEYSVEYVTFYLKLDGQNNIIDADYTMLRFINLMNLSQQEDIVIQDYALELDNIYYSAFSDTLTRECNLYDTLFTTTSSESTDLTLLKRYSCTFS